MASCHDKYFSYHINVEDVTKREKPQDNKEVKEEPKKEKTNGITLFGMKISYAKAFGVAFMVLFALLFFPGIGVSSSQVKKEETAAEKDGQENAK